MRFTARFSSPRPWICLSSLAFGNAVDKTSMANAAKYAIHVDYVPMYNPPGPKITMPTLISYYNKYYLVKVLIFQHDILNI